MFGALSSAVNSALATLAPDVPLIQDFRHQWQLFLQYYTTKALPNYRSQPVERTNQVYHLNNLMKLLLQEQEQLEHLQHQEDETCGTSHTTSNWSDRDISTDTISKQARQGSLSNNYSNKCKNSEVLTRLGPCMEFVIERQILDILSTLCQADIPPGLRPHIIRVFIFFMTHIKQTILPYVGVYLPIRRLLALCSVVKASPTESEELVFIMSLVTHLKRCPDLLTLFAHQPNPGDASHSNSLASSRASSIADLSSEIARMIARPSPDLDLLPRGYNSHHILVSAVLNYVDSADYLISCKAMNCLQVVCSFEDEAAAFNATHGTTLCSVITQRLVLLYSSLPKKLCCPGDLKINWMESHHHLQGEEFEGRTELVAFFAWLDFCDDTIDKAQPSIAEALSFSIREEFLEKVLEEDLYESPEQAMSRLTQCWNHIRSEGLANQFSCWLFGDDGGPDLKNVVMHPLKDHLINQCLSDDKDLAIETLAFFNSLLERPCQPMLQSLFTNNLETRGYFLNSAVEATFTCWSDEEDEREKQQHSAAVTHSNRRTGLATMSTSRTLAPSNIGRIVNLWLSLVPDSLRSTAVDAESSGYEQYVRNAQAQLPNVVKKCAGFEWPVEATSPQERSETCNSDSSSKPESELDSFYEGQFLSSILDLVETILDRDYDVNLEVTALCAKLAYLPHPYTHEYLLNPTIPLTSHSRNLFTALQCSIEKGLIATRSMAHVQEKIYACKKNLLGSRNVDRSLLNLSRSEAHTIDALIILEEFCKELAAITLAKFHYAA